MKKLTGISLFIFFCVVSAILVAGFIFYQNKDNTNKNADVKITLPSKDLILNLKEVIKHNIDTDCWMVINNKVYNVSNFSSSHPGGSKNILNYCGKEATEAFNTKGGKGDPHSTSANNFLSKLYIGDLAK
jgi:cytochrome b involved in lipid metabolism